MKKLFIPFVSLLLISAGSGNSSLTHKERKFAIDHFTDSKILLLDAIEGLSKEQLNFKDGPSSWSVTECIEHLALFESTLFGLVEVVLGQPADPTRRGEVNLTDDEVLALVIDRSNKVKTEDRLEPKNKFGSQEIALKKFVTKRDNHIEYIKNTKGDFRNRYQQMPFATLDAYQLLLFISGHTERHAMQIEEIKTQASFPK